MESTSSFAQAMEWALELCGELNVPRVWIPEKCFVDAVRDGQSLSFTRTTDKGLFGLALGPTPILSPTWNEFALPQGSETKLTQAHTVNHNWETHAIETKSQSYEIELLELSLIHI